MGSRRLATVDLDPVRTASDLAASQQFRYNDSYAEFVSIGRLYSTMLWNQSGELDESSLGDYDGPAQQTPNGRALPYFSEVLGRLFRMDRLKYLRFMRIAPGTVYVPHRDFLELKTQMLRIHLPVQTDDMVFASEENTVFRMRLGELWQLDASRTHCVGSFSTADRIHLVCDFVADSLDQVLIDQVPDGQMPTENIVARADLGADRLQALLGLAQILDQQTYPEVLSLLIKQHFLTDVSGDGVFTLLKQIAAIGGRPDVIARVEKQEEYCMVRR